MQSLSRAACSQRSNPLINGHSLIISLTRTSAFCRFKMFAWMASGWICPFLILTESKNDVIINKFIKEEIA